MHAMWCRASDSQHSGSIMKAIQVLSAITFAALSASAFAGPNWDAINSARKAAQQQRVASAGDASDQAMRDHCAMMGQMSATGDKMHQQMMHRSDSQPSNAGAALFGERAAAMPVGSRTVVVVPGMKAVPVRAGETVRFDFGQCSTAWTFAARQGNSAVELSTLFPEIPAAKGVWAYPNGTGLYAGH